MNTQMSFNFVCVYFVSSFKGAITGPITALALMLWIGLGAKVNNVVVTPLSHITTEGCHILGNNMSTTLLPTTTLVMNATNATMDITGDGWVVRERYIKIV